MILNKAIDKYFNSETSTKLVAVIRADNIPSIKIFTNTDFREFLNKGEWKEYHFDEK